MADKPRDDGRFLTFKSLTNLTLNEMYMHYCRRMETILDDECIKHDYISDLPVLEKHKYYSQISIEIMVLEDIVFEMTKRRMNTEAANLYLQLLT